MNVLPPFRALLTLMAMIFAAIGQYAHTFAQANTAAAFFFVGAVFFWGIAMVTSRIAIDTRMDDSARPCAPMARRTSTGPAIGVMALALVTFLTSTENTFTFDNASAWLLSIAVFFYAFWEPEKNWNDWHAWLRECITSARASFSNGFRISARPLILFGILLVGTFFYYHNLDGVPAEMTSDHAEKLLDVNDVVQGARPIFFERNTGREPLEFYLVAALIEWGKHPLDHMALKLVTATFGWLVIPGAFFLARELFDEDIALLAAALIAVSKWPVTIARMGLRFPFTSVFLAPTLFFLFRALKYQRRNDFLLAGLFLGVGLYGYNASRMAPVLAAVFLALWPLIGRKIERGQISRYVTNSLLMFALAFVIFVPLLRYSLDHPENFWYRVLTRLSAQERLLPDNPAKTLASNLVNVSLMFNGTGDEAWPNSIPGDPALDYIAGGLFLLGVPYALYRLARFREWTYAFVLIGLGIMLLPSALSLAFPNENPSNVRAGGAIPFVFIVVALPMVWMARTLKQAWSPIAAIGFIVFFIVIIARVNYLRYFHDFDISYREASWNSSEVAGVIRGFAESVGDYDHAWILLYPHWIDTRNVAINMGRIGWDQTLPKADAARSQVKDGANKLYVLSPNDADNLTRLQAIFPNGQLRVFHARTPGHDFNLWYVPGTIAPDAPLNSQ